MEIKPERPLWKQKIDVESVKREGLDVDLSRLEKEGYAGISAEDFYRLKMHGICSQRTPGVHMLRIRVPGGKVSVAQLRGLAALSERLADGGAHITTRQNLELHSVPTEKLREALAGLTDIGLSTRSTCGHTVRNIVGCSAAGLCADEPFDTQPTVEAIHQFFLARASHYNARLPRRLNVYVAGCSSCMTHAQINDIGFVATKKGGKLGFQLWCAGSLGASPRLAHFLFGFIPIEEALAVTEAVADVYCEHGFREKPAKARLKYLIEEWGEERFAEAVLERLRQIRPGTRVMRNGDLPVLGPDRRQPGKTRGVFPQRQPGFVRIEARVPLGDFDGPQMHALAALGESHADGYLYLTREQNAELHWVREDLVESVTKALSDARLYAQGAGGLVDVQVCAGTEWCIWGVGDSRGLATDIEESLADIATSDPNAEPLRLHISGCHHGCASHQVSDIGLVATSVKDDGEKTDGYEVLGGGKLGLEPRPGKRLGRLPLGRTSPEVIRLLRTFLTDRQEDESFPDFLERTGIEVGAAPALSAPGMV